MPESIIESVSVPGILALDDGAAQAEGSPDLYWVFREGMAR